MFLKSLVLRGFKSFADKTYLAFEPGISVVVGPNGSGKSNVIDAISWVLGEQGPATLRGGKMEDVIFAGSATRPPLGMAEVQLTIDNSAGLLPVEFAEVTISRTLFRSGDSEYRMNGSICRLLDISEMLSDAGVGKEQHTIVGQGRLDEVLSADPVQMRNIIEDAAGVGKHRRRKERALRKIAATETNLDHLSDLLAEIRRQLKPLRQQAEIAERHSRMRQELHGIKLVSIARQLAALEEELGSPEAGRREEELHARESAVAALQEELAVLEARRLESLAAIAGGRELAWRLNGAGERLAALRRLAGERARTLRAELAARNEDVEQARLVELRSQQAELEAALAEAERQEAAEVAALGEVQPASDAARDALAAAERALNEALLASAQASAEAGALRRELSAIGAAARDAEMERRRQLERAEAAELKRRQLASQVAAAELELDLAGARLRPAEVAAQEAESRLQELTGLRERLVDEIRNLEKQVAVLRARAAARAAAEARRTPSGAAVRPVPGTRLLSELVDLDPLHRRALEALVGPVDAVVVAFGAESAWTALHDPDTDDAVTILLAGEPGAEIPGAEPLAGRLGLTDPAARAALADFFVAPDGREALRLAAVHRHAVFLSDDGTVAHGGLVTKGSAQIASAIAELEHKAATAREALAGLDREVAAARNRVKDASAARREAEKAHVRAAEHLRVSEVESQRAEARAAETAQALQSPASAAESQDRPAELERRLEQAEKQAAEADAALEAARSERQSRAEAYEQASRASEAARMRAGIAAERTRQQVSRLTQVVDAISDTAGRLSGLGARQEALLRAQRKVSSVAAACEALAGPAAAWAAEARQRHAEAVQAGAGLDREIGILKARLHEASKELDRSREAFKREDLSLTERRIRQRILQAALADEMQADPETAVARWGRRIELSEGESPSDPTERIAALPDEVLRKRQQRLERELEQIGSVNPLAAREAEALAEREQFLARQMDDVRSSRKDLRQVVASVDEKIREMFTAAFDDVAREYAHLFSVLFPQGRGRLRLTDPTELLESGVEVEASPSGKALKRLSLLSGGERAMAALALLFAIFKSRPSPFYILDEVEAALDDVNLQRFLGLLDEFRGSSQLLVVTHQKKTMEIADVLYGVVMRPDGVTRVISERLTDFFPASVSSPGSGIGVDLE